MKTNNDTLKPVHIKVIPRIGIEKGLALVALVQKQNTIELFE